MTGLKLLVHHPIQFVIKQIKKTDNIMNKKKDIKKYKADVEKYKNLNTREEFQFNPKYEYSFITQWREVAGNPGSYFWQDLWGAQRVIGNHPKEHYDIGSRIDGFISHIMLHPDIKCHLIDIRPLEKSIPGVWFKQADATNLDGIDDDSIESLSALCSFEHFGLGRYGDPIDPEACFKAFKASQRVVKPGGYIYISVPVGENHVCFNAHRVFSPKLIISEYDQCECMEMSVIDLDADPVLKKVDDPINFHLSPEVDHLIGLFMFRKK